MFIEILFKMLLFKWGVLIYAEHCIYIFNIPYTTSAKCDALYGIMYSIKQHGAVLNKKYIFYM